MKNFTLFVFFLVFVGSFGFSQDMNHIRIGIKAGYNYNLSQYKTNKNLPVKGVHGGYAGMLLKIPFDNRLYFVPQMDVSYRGTKTDSPQKYEFSSIKEFHLRVMPLLQIEFTNPAEKRNTWFLQIGPSIGFGITGKQIKQDGNNVPVSANLKYGYQAYGRYDANWHTGLGYETTDGLRILLDYAHGLGNMINTENAGRLKYRTISLGVGYWLSK
jgi:hypothetical protein